MNPETIMRSIHDCKQVTGDKLNEADRRAALAAYVHRHTAEHVPAWARKEWKDGKPYPVQFASDAEWLAHTRFAVKRDGTLRRDVAECHSTPTWPNNPELRIDREQSGALSCEDGCGING